MDEENGKALAQINKAERALACAEELFEIIKVRDVMAASHLFAVAQGLVDAAQAAKVVQLKAERKAGGVLLGMEKNIGGDRKSTDQADRLISQYAAALSDNNIPEAAARRWQQVARLPEKEFTEWLDEKVAKGWEITAGGLRAYVKNFLKPEGHAVTFKEEALSVIVAIIENAIDNDDADYLLSEECAWYLKCAKVQNPETLITWAKRKCPPADIHVMMKTWLRASVGGRAENERPSVTPGKYAETPPIETFSNPFLVGSEADLLSKSDEEWEKFNELLKVADLGGKGG